MKIALAQTHIIWEDKEKNEINAVENIVQAVNAGAEAIFFPEMSLTGFSMNTKATAEKDEETVTRFRKLACGHNVAIGIGWAKRRGELAENHYTIIGRQGDVLSDYVKIHPFSYAGEDKFFVPGSKISYFELGGYNWSNFICYDLRFPELFQIASRKAEAILVPANWPRRRERHWKSLLTARAIENQCYILAVNCVGVINGVEYSGGSCGISAEGEMVSMLEGEAGIAVIDLQENIAELRRKFPVKQDRRWDLYVLEYRGGNDSH